MIRYIEKVTIPCYDTDAAWRLKPASFMNIAQEAAGRHAVHLGFGYDDLIKSNTAWILSRVHVEFVDTPKWREDITMTIKQISVFVKYFYCNYSGSLRFFVSW